MACHLDGGICPHDFGMGGGGSYLSSASSSYGLKSSYANLGQYNGQINGSSSYASAPTRAENYLQATNPLGLASYAANPKYDAAYKGVGQYVGQSAQTNTGSAKSQNAARTKQQFPFSNYRANAANQEREVDESVSLAEQPQDIARPTISAKTIDDTLDAQNAVAVQRNFLEQMIQSARQQSATVQPQMYRMMYQ